MFSYMEPENRALGFGEGEWHFRVLAPPSPMFRLVLLPSASSIRFAVLCCHARRIVPSRGLCTAGLDIQMVQSVPDEAIQRLLRAHGRALGAAAAKKETRESKPDDSSKEPKVSLRSLLDMQDKMRQELGPDTLSSKEQGLKTRVRQEGSDLAIFLGTLKPVQGSSSEKQPDKWVKLREKIARRRPVVSVKPETSNQPENRVEETEDVKEQDLGEVAITDVPASCERTLPLRIDLSGGTGKNISNMGSVGSAEELFAFDLLNKPVLDNSANQWGDTSDGGVFKQPSRTLSKLSSFLDRLKKGDFMVSQDIQPAEEVPVKRIWPKQCQNIGSDAIDQGAWNMFQAFDLVDIDGSDISAATLKKLVRSFEMRDIIDGSIEVLYATRDAGFLPSSATYTCLICLLLKAGQHQKANQVLEELLLEGTKLGSAIYITLIDAFERAGDLDTLYQLFAGMQESNYKVDVDTTRKVFTALLKAGRVDQTYTLSQDLVIRGSGIDVDSCNLLIDSLGKSGNLQWAVRFLDNMRGGLCTPNLVTYNCLLNHLVKGIKIKDACKVFKLIRRDRLCPDRTSYHFVISGLCKAEKPRLALRYFEKLKDSGEKPDAATYSCLIGSYGKLGKIGQALELFMEMKRINVPLDVVVFNTMIQAIGKSKKATLAFSMFEELKYRGFVPDLWTFNLLLNALAKTGKSRMALKAFREMCRRGLTPDVVTYTALINCLGNSGAALKAYKVHEKMIKKRCEPNIRTWNSLLKGLAKDDLIELAFSVYKKMGERGCPPDKVTFSILLDLSTCLRDIRKVLRLQKDIRNAEIEPDEGMKKIVARSMKFVRRETRCPFDTESLIRA